MSPFLRGQDGLFRHARWAIALLVFAVGGPGCQMVPVSVSNPVPGLTTVAVAPFINLSGEPTADGRRFAMSYYSELQKIPGFQVIPVGIVEEAIRENGLALGSPADAVELARILKADAIVVGAITDYRPYYPPQVGLQVEWFSPREWLFYPGVPFGDPAAGEASPAAVCPPGAATGDHGVVLRGQSPEPLSDEWVDAGDAGDMTQPDDRFPFLPIPTRPQSPGGRGGGTKPTPLPTIWPSRDRAAVIADQTSFSTHRSRRDLVARQSGAPQPAAPKPLMAYTRFFDGADPKLVRSLQEYVAYRGDMRSGGWEAHLHRSDDFIRFTAHLMIFEMLTLHGGVVKTESIAKFWK